MNTVSVDRAVVDVDPGFIELQHWGRWAIPRLGRWCVVDEWLAPSRGIRVRWAIIRSMTRPCPVWPMRGWQSQARQRAMTRGAK